MSLPIEFAVIGRPASVNACSDKKRVWKKSVRVAAQAALDAKIPPSTSHPHADSVTVKLFYFPANRQYIDVDNGLKYTIDGMCPPLLTNDKQIFRVIAERFPLTPGSSLIVPVAMASEVAGAIDSALSLSPRQHVTAVKVEIYKSDDGAAW